MRVLKLTVAYDGTRFVGWQRQAEGESIQGLLEDALARFEGASVTVHGAGRTDAGVHALAQVASASVSFTHECSAIIRGLNASLPQDVRVTGVDDADPGFHARFGARSKTYRYVIERAPVASPFSRAFAWHVPERLDVDAIRAAAAALVGTHDFAAFQSAGSETSGTVRTITYSEVAPREDVALWRAGSGRSGPALPALSERMRVEGSERSESKGAYLVYEIAGDGFLRHMVRAIVGTLVEVGRGWRSADSMRSLLTGGDRHAAGATAPSHGLFLVSVDYD